MDSKLYHFIALSQVPKVGPKTARMLISYAGGILEVFELSKKELMKIPSIGNAVAESILSKSYFDIADKEYKFAEKNNVQVLSYLDKSYPQRCLHFEDAPLVLYYKGNADLNYDRTVGIVGTRNPSQYGKNTCEKVVDGLERYSPLVVSGLAYGIDATAHNRAVDKGIATVGVLGHGLDKIYPAQNKKLAQRMLEDGGLLSEFISGTGPEREHFPMRNRIIAGLSDAVVVVESARKGGSIITAEIANGYNKDVFAIPGRTTDETSEGCNKLIKQNKAHLLETADDIGYIMRWETDSDAIPKQSTLLLDLEEDEQKIYNLLKQGDKHVDSITHHLKQPMSKVMSTLLTMEFKGYIKSLPGKQYGIF